MNSNKENELIQSEDNGQKALNNIKDYLIGEKDKTRFLQDSPRLSETKHDSFVETKNPIPETKEVEPLASNNEVMPKVLLHPYPINPNQLLLEIEKLIREVIICNEETIVAAVLWIAMTWFIDDIKVAPLAVITAPEKRCGKSQLLFLMGRLVCRPISASNITPAALFRSIELWKPTLLLDEADTFIKNNEDLRGIINSGHTRNSAFVIRVVGKELIPQQFNVWGAKAIAGIGNLPDTLMDRAINLQLRRKRENEKITRLRHIDENIFNKLTSKLARFSTDYCRLLRGMRPELPLELNDREQDNWEALLAIAEIAGNDWVKRARDAALKISRNNQDATVSMGVELLSAIYDIFENKMTQRLSSAELIRELCQNEELPWSTYNRGLPISPRQIATLLKGYGIKSKGIRVGYGTPKGYEKEQFLESFSRYLITQES
jgi:putative DNA primase/helicase